MSHDAIREIVGNARAAMDGTWMPVRVGHLIALIEERDRLATEVERLREDRGIVTWPERQGIKGTLPVTGYRSVEGQYGLVEDDVPPFIRDHVQKPGAVDEGDKSDPGDQGWRHSDGSVAWDQEPQQPTQAPAPPCCDCYPWCDCDEASKEPEQPPAIAHDTQDGDEMVTVNLNPSEQGAVDAILVQVSESGAITGPVEVLARDIERAVCGDRQPPSQEAEMLAKPARPPQIFVEDRKDEPSGAKIVPWKASYTPDKCLLAIRMLSDGKAVVSVAAAADLEKITVSDISKQYRKQIDLASEMGAGEREQFFGSMYRQMLARWVAAGNDPAVQPSGPLKKMTLSQAAGVGQKKPKVQP